MTTAIVCGGRSFGCVPKDLHKELRGYAWGLAKAQRCLFFNTMFRLKNERGITAIIHPGERGTGALARVWALRHDVPDTAIGSDKSLKRRADRVRNAQMLAMKPDFVIAFPGGDGTYNMIKQAIEAGIEVIDMRGAS